MLNSEEAIAFLGELLSQFRIHKDGNNPVYPFSLEAANTMIVKIAQEKSLTPRRIMLYANHVLTEYLLNTTNSTDEINNGEILSLLNDPQLGDLDVNSV